MSTVKEIQSIGNMLRVAKEHGMQTECVWSLVNEIGSLARNPTTEDVEKACAAALYEWDI